MISKKIDEQVKSLLSHPGCWLNDTSSEGKRCPSDKECTSCPAYIEFYKTADHYMKFPAVRNWSEALWLTHKFYGIQHDYMCDGMREEWLKQYAPKRYRDNLARQAALMSGIEPPEPSAPVEEDGIHQMTIFDLIGATT